MRNQEKPLFQTASTFLQILYPFQIYALYIYIMPYVIKLSSALLTRDTELLGKMDPFVTLKIGSLQLHSKVAKGGGKSPVFYDSFTINEAQGDYLQIQVWDKEKIFDDIVGKGHLSLSNYKSTTQTPVNINLSHQGKSAGTLKATILYQGGGGYAPTYPQPQPQLQPQPQPYYQPQPMMPPPQKPSGIVQPGQFLPEYAPKPGMKR